MNCTFIIWLPMDAAKKPCLARLKILPAIGSPTEPCPGDDQAQARLLDAQAAASVRLTILEPVPATK